MKVDPSPETIHRALVVAALLTLLCNCSTGRVVPVKVGVAAMHQTSSPDCESVVATGGSMGTSHYSTVQVNACGTTTTYACTTDVLPADDHLAHARMECTPSFSLRGTEIRNASDEDSEKPSRPVTIDDRASWTSSNGNSVVQ